MSNYSQRLRNARLWLNLTQRELGLLIGVSRNSVYRYENKIRNVPPNVRQWIDELYRTHDLDNFVIKSAKDNSPCSFTHLHCYSIVDEDKIIHRLYLNPCILDFSCNYVFQYLGTHGIHHYFRELHGGWARTYTNSQLIDKRIQELPYYPSMTG